jgi:DNA polymerase-3 subunit delta
VSRTIHALDFLPHPEQHPPAPLSVVFGDEPFLKRLVLGHLRRAVLGEEETPFAMWDGPTAVWREILDELSTRAMFGGGRRLVVVDDADPFVSANRARLEDYADKPKSGGVLVLNVVTWASNTRLYKALDERGLQIECRAPERPVGKRKVLDEERLVQWLADWSTRQHGVRLAPASARLLFELVGPEFGLLDQSLAKLALFLTPGGGITPEMVRDIVGGWRTKTVWELLDAACSGRTVEALRELDRLLQAGEEPLGLLGPMAWSLRRFAAATRAVERAERERRKPSLPQALQQAGFFAWPKDAMAKAEQQLRLIGRERAGQLYRWLLEADLALKGTHSTGDRARLVLEQLIVRLARPLASPRK